MELLELIREKEKGVYLTLDNHRSNHLIASEPSRWNTSHVRVQDSCNGRLRGGCADNFEDLLLEEIFEFNQEVFNLLLSRVMRC